MTQRYGLLSMSLLTAAAVIGAALSVDPKAFSLRDWQPLMAALVALGGGATVYRGALLTYRAAMAKVDLDRLIHQRSIKRKDLGICLRLEYTLVVLAFEAKQAVLGISQFNREPREITYDDVHVPEPPGMIEAWENLDALPEHIATAVSDIRGMLYDFTAYKRFLSGRSFTINPYLPPPNEMVRVRDTAQALAVKCDATVAALGALVKALRD